MSLKCVRFRAVSNVLFSGISSNGKISPSFPVPDLSIMGAGQSSQVPEPVSDIPQNLPVEVLENIFKFLEDLKDRKAVVVVGKQWRKAGEAPNLWTSVKLPVVLNQKSRARAIEMLRARRFSKVDEIEIDGAVNLSEELLQAVAGHTGLKRIVLDGVADWAGWRLGWKHAEEPMPAGLDSLLETLTGVEELYCFVPNYPIKDLLTEVSQGGTSLTTLRISSNNLDKVPGPILAGALTNLVEVYLGTDDPSRDQGVPMTEEQVTVLMEAIEHPGSSLKVLTIFKAMPLQRINNLNLTALVHLEEVNLWNCQLTQREVSGFFGALSPSTRLRSLTLFVHWADFEVGATVGPVNWPWTGRFWPAEDMMDGSTEVMATGINFLEKVLLAPIFPYQVSNL